MPDSCAAWGCKNRRTTQTRSRGITFHKFPKEKHLRRQWEISARKNVSVHSVLCSEHFRPEDFDRTGQTVRIRDGVRPSVFSYRTCKKPRKTRTSQKALEELPVDYSLKKQKTGQSQKTLQDLPVDYSLKIRKISPDSNTLSNSKGVPHNIDHCYALPSSPAIIKARLHEALARVESLEREIRNMRSRERRAKNSVHELLEDLKQKNLINGELKDKLKVYSEIPIDLLVKQGHEYTQDQKDFAINLHLHGPKAYNYLRKSLHLNLPHPYTLQRWMGTAGDKTAPNTTSETCCISQEEDLDTENVTVVQSLEELHERGIRVLWTVDDLPSDISISTEIDS
ncbi:THAP domain-containing protein 6-like [Triplophysa dalaica]|uniref:THAP domain-containing protein 6-like n=1 Tax=Triplophysa dalaica TaxID=1582913 RepID=UPI0024DF73B3|nr:THAP domain-containing protein 6-like [Triplophysa dalaica]